MRLTQFWQTAIVVVVLGLVACRPGDEAQQGEDSTPAEDAAMSETMGDESDAAGAQDVEQPKNLMLIEFVEPIQEADLEWLKENGFQVDTVFSETTLRGWLEVPEGGEVIGTDPRVARIDAMMR